MKTRSIYHQQKPSCRSRLTAVEPAELCQMDGTVVIAAMDASIPLKNHGKWWLNQQKMVI